MGDKMIQFIKQRKPRKPKEYPTFSQVRAKMREYCTQADENPVIFTRGRKKYTIFALGEAVKEQIKVENQTGTNTL